MKDVETYEAPYIKTDKRQTKNVKTNINKSSEKPQVQKGLKALPLIYPG
jgi:hypothetical protein